MLLPAFLISREHIAKAYTMVGDPHYMAPERISGQGYGYGVDYWSLGILLYAMLHVDTPFASLTTETQVRQECREAVRERRNRVLATSSWVCEKAGG